MIKAIIFIFSLLSFHLITPMIDDIQPHQLITVANAVDIKLWKILVSADLDGVVMQDITFSQDGTWLATIQREYDRSFEGKVRIWNIKTWEEDKTFIDNSIEAMSISFSSESSLLVTGKRTGEVTFTNLQTGRKETTIKADISHINAIAIHPKESLAAIASSGLGIAKGDFAFTLVNFGSGEIIGRLVTCSDKDCPGPGFTTAFNPIGDLVAFATTNGTVRIWDTKSSEELATTTGANFSVSNMMFTPDGKQLAYVAGDGIRIWNVEAAIQKDGKKDDFQVIATPAEGEFIQSMALSPDGTVLAVGYLDSTIKLWNLASGEQLTILEGHKDRVVSLAFSPDGTLLASGGTDGTVRLWGVKE